MTQDLLGEADLEFAWGDVRPADPEQAKIIDICVRDGIYAVNEARGLLGLDPVPGGDVPMVYGTQGAVPLAQVKTACKGSLRKLIQTSLAFPRAIRTAASERTTAMAVFKIPL